MSKPKLIGLSGYARSGKDTVAEYLVKEHGYTRVAFADALRDALYALNPSIPYPFDGQTVQGRLQTLVDNFGWDSCKTAFPEVRELLQRMGTEVGRNLLGPNVWVDIAMRKVAAVDGPVVITDMRFPNEYAAIRKDHNGLAWRIIRPGTEPVNAHSSETAIDTLPFNETIHNEGTIQELQALIWVLVQ